MEVEIAIFQVRQVILSSNEPYIEEIWATAYLPGVTIVTIAQLPLDECSEAQIPLP